MQDDASRTGSHVQAKEPSRVVFRVIGLNGEETAGHAMNIVCGVIDLSSSLLKCLF